jgi:hypothetical protein
MIPIADTNGSEIPIPIAPRYDTYSPESGQKEPDGHVDRKCRVSFLRLRGSGLVVQEGGRVYRRVWALGLAILHPLDTTLFTDLNPQNPNPLY